MGAQLAFEALNRSLVVLPEEDLVSTQIEIGQGLFWAITLDDRLARKYKGYRRARDADDEGRYADGARLARNAITHGAVVMQEYQPGLSFPVVFPLSLGGYRWRPVEGVFADWLDRIEPPAPQLESYRRLFTGLQPIVPIAMMRNWLGRAPGLGFDL
jgi:hypothetical protein